MIEIVLVILIVAAATIYVVGRVSRQLKGQGCGGCKCGGAEKAQTLLNLRSPVRKDDAHDR